MALNKAKTADKTSPAFEAPDEGAAAETTTVDRATAARERLAAAAAEQAKEQAATAAPASESRAVTTPAAGGGAVALAKRMVDPFRELEKVFPVQFDTLRNLVVTNGNVMDKSTNKVLGSEVAVELLSWQPQWVVSPGVDGEEGKEHVRYSDDGVTCTDGVTSVQGHLQHLLSTGFTKAKVEERVVLAFAILKAPKFTELEGTLAQISLPKTSMAKFKQYRMEQAFNIGKGHIDADGAVQMLISCELATNKGNTWTIANFSRYEG